LLVLSLLLLLLLLVLLGWDALLLVLALVGSYVGQHRVPSESGVVYVVREESSRRKVWWTTYAGEHHDQTTRHSTCHDKGKHSFDSDDGEQKINAYNVQMYYGSLAFFNETNGFPQLH